MINFSPKFLPFIINSSKKGCSAEVAPNVDVCHTIDTVIGFTFNPVLKQLQRLLLGLCMAFSVGAASAQLLEVKVGIYQNEPKILMGGDGQPSGILGDLLVEIAKREGWQLVASLCEWQACLEALQAGKLDLMPDVAYTEQRAGLFDFHKVPALLSWS